MNLNIVSVQEVAKMLGVCPDTVYKLCREDKDFPAIAFGHKWKIVGNLLPAYIEKKLANK